MAGNGIGAEAVGGRSRPEPLLRFPVIAGRVAIIMVVRWYTCYRPSTANIRALLAERHIDVSARIMLSWVHTFGPLLAAEGRR